GNYPSAASISLRLLRCHQKRPRPTAAHARSSTSRSIGTRLTEVSVASVALSAASATSATWLLSRHSSFWTAAAAVLPPSCPALRSSTCSLTTRCTASATLVGLAPGRRDRRRSVPDGFAKLYSTP